MSRERMITRTIETKTVEVMTVNTETADIKTMVLTVGADYTKAQDNLKYLRKHYETETIKIVTIVHETVTTKLYGMTEQDFIANAKILPNRE